MTSAPERRIALVRHGETDWNRELRLQGRTEVPLNDTGRAQAAATALRLASAGSWSGALASPLGRAIETAEIIAAGLDVSAPKVDVGLWERNFGEAEGRIIAEANELWPGLSGIPGAEEIESVADRGTATVRRLLATANGSVVVAHGALLRITLSALTGTAVPRIPNGAVFIVTQRGESGAINVTPLAD